MIYAISDLHLDITTKKDMSIFGRNWGNYEQKIFLNWNKIIKEDDFVLIPGDISWAMKLSEATLDLDRVEPLNGHKLMMRGNHDYWWESLKKLNSLNYKTIDFLHNNSYKHKNSVIVGTRGWDSRDKKGFDNHDEKIFARELTRLELSIKDALRKYDNYDEIICIMHYPPFLKNLQPNEFETIFKKYDIKKVVYGHVHGEHATTMPIDVIINGIWYVCVSADLIDFKPVLITE